MVTTQYQPDMPDAQACTRVPHDTDGNLITNGVYRYTTGRKTMTMHVEEDPDSGDPWYWPPRSYSERRHYGDSDPDGNWERVK